MPISERKVNANRRNWELGRKKCSELRRQRSAYNNELIPVECICDHCHKTFIKMIKRIDAEKKKFPKHCSRSCANSRVRSDELKHYLHEKFTHKVLVNGKRVMQHRYCKGCGKILPFGLTSNRRYCSDACRIQYKQKERNAVAFTSKRLYKEACRFLFNVYKYPTEFDLALINQYGWYSPKNKHDNPDGVSRDHMYSISMGFKNHVPPHLLAHPANCQLLLQKENFKKLGKCSITLDELKERIRLWDRKYGTYVPNSQK
jgi:predicted nucleic acid-binding Zn ribbon protein